MNATRREQEVVVLDFETTGMSPERGHRAIEIGAVLLCGDRIVERYQSLMNPGVRVNGFIQQLTGITNDMVRRAPPPDQVMGEFARFIGERPLVAHNASFDRRFLDAELAHLGLRRRGEFGCSLLAARRIYPQAPNHRLETLVEFVGLPSGERFHRALADAEMTAHLWLRMAEELKSAYGFASVPFELLKSLGRVSRPKAAAFLERSAREQTCRGAI